MKRKLYDTLLEWKRRDAGKYALLIDGARRVGKSYLAEEFARREYENHVVIDFAEIGADVKRIFNDELRNLDVFFMLLQSKLGVSLTPGRSLVVFDEVQRFPRAREAIKYLVKDGRYHYLETGSLISLNKNVKNIVIPSEELHVKLYPMDFEEFLWATGNPVLMDYIRQCFMDSRPMGESMHRQAMGLFRQYMIVGGMPQAVAEYASSHDLGAVDRAKRAILNLYREDIQKYSGRTAAKIEGIWDELPAALSRHEKRFRPGTVSGSGRMRELSDAFQWLKNSMTVNVCYNSTEPTVGLKMNMDRSTLKGYLADTGLLVSHAFDENRLNAEEIHKRILFESIELNEGMLVENMVAQMLTASGKNLYFFSKTGEKGTGDRMEVDFLTAKDKLSRRKNLSVIEVKSSKRFTAVSLGRFIAKYKAFIDKAYVLCPKDIFRKDGLVTLPLYMAPFL